jgi:adenylylsulfate kinase-like enzyme
MIYWFIGQPGHGKTVLSDLLKEKLEVLKNQKVFRIDGDDLRSLTSNQDYSKEGRIQNITRAQFIAHYLHNQGHDVIVSLVAPYLDLRESFKEKMGGDLLEFYVHTTEIRGREQNHTQEFEPPVSNFVDVSTTNTSPQESIDKIWQIITK